MPANEQAITSLDDYVQFAGNPEGVSILDPVSYQFKANSNYLSENGVNFDIKRTTFYAQEEK